MKSPRDLVAAISAMPLPGTVRILNLSSDHERTINLFGLRRVLPNRVRLLAGPGSAACVCPQEDIYQAIQLARHHDLTLYAPPALFDTVLNAPVSGPRSLREASLDGADIQLAGAPVEAVMAARDRPEREVVLFLAGFEALLGPLAGMILEGLPPNLSLLLCGRRVDPLLEDSVARAGPWFEAVLLPGNRCAVTGTRSWEGISARLQLPAVVAGYTLAGLLGAVHALLSQAVEGKARVDNLYRALVRPDGNPMVRDAMERVFEIGEGGWRGLGRFSGSAYRLRQAYAGLDADERYPSYRGELDTSSGDLPDDCDCAAVLLGRREPHQCRHYQLDCRIATPHGPCMSSPEGVCHQRSLGLVA
jgi:hydrogenase expression/formation protein HypD